MTRDEVETTGIVEYIFATPLFDEFEVFARQNCGIVSRFVVRADLWKLKADKGEAIFAGVRLTFREHLHDDRRATVLDWRLAE